MSDTYVELADRCRRKGLVLELGVAATRREDGARLDPPVWWLSVTRRGEEPITRGARGPVEKVLVALAREVAQALSKAGW